MVAVPRSMVFQVNEDGGVVPQIAGNPMHNRVSLERSIAVFALARI